jgi:hypothetical protein
VVVKSRHVDERRFVVELPVSELIDLELLRSEMGIRIETRDFQREPARKT